MARFNLKLNGNKAILEKLDRYSDKVRDMVSDEIQAATYTTHAKAITALQSNPNARREGVTTDNGSLVQLTTAQFDPAQLTGRVTAGSKYAAYVEFGTGGFVDVPEGVEDYAMTFYVNGKGTMRPSPFLFPAFFTESKKMLEQIRKELVKWN